MPPAEPDVAAAPSGDRLVAVGVFGAAHGVRGEVRLKSYTADPVGIGDLGALADAQGRARWTLTAVRHLRDDLLVVKIAGIGDRTAAEVLTGRELFVSRASLPAAQDNEFYHVDLIGLRAETEHGVPVGLVRAVQNFGGGDLLEIVVPGVRDTLLLPFTKAMVPCVDVAGGRVIVGLPAETEAETPAVEPTGGS